jgi:16S rRNA (cytosine967-C5)-methyltransferase
LGRTNRSSLPIVKASRTFNFTGEPASYIGRDAYLAKLQSLDIQARAFVFEAGIVLEQSVQITQLPGFEQGWFSVQDEHAQLCSTLLPDLNNKTVIDACAALCGKTAHLLEKFKSAQSSSIDQDPSRLVRVTENLNRLALDQSHTEILAADATKWTPVQPVDCI